MRKLFVNYLFLIGVLGMLLSTSNASAAGCGCLGAVLMGPNAQAQWKAAQSYASSPEFFEAVCGLVGSFEKRNEDWACVIGKQLIISDAECVNFEENETMPNKLIKFGFTDSIAASGAFFDGECKVPEITENKDAAGKSDISLSVDNLKERAQSLNVLGVTTVPELIRRLITLLMAFMGTILFALYIYAGLTWMTANGNDEKITSAKNILVWSTLGVAVMLASYIIVTFIFGALTGANP